MTRPPGSVAAIILAGGQSARMGQPKALLEFDGRSFVARGAASLRAAGCDPVLAVDGAHRLDPALPGLVEAGVVLVHNRDWPAGPLSSLQVGLRAALELDSDLAGLLVHHVERPRIATATFAALLAAFSAARDGLWQPRYAGRSGHPMIFPRPLFAQLLELDPMRASARDLVRGAAAARRRWLEVDDPAVLENLDTPSDLLGADLRGYDSDQN